MTINFSTLPAPEIVEELNYEAILSSMVEDLRARDPSYTEILESDPGVKIMEVCAARELIIRQRVNDAFRATLLRFANGADLDNLAAFYNVARLEDEQDPAFRLRTIERIMGSSSAGGAAWYRYHALTASPFVKDANITSPQPGYVQVSVLSSEGQSVTVAEGGDLDSLGVMWGVLRFTGESDASYRERVEAEVLAGGGYGAASPALLELVRGVVDGPTVRPVSDTVTVASAEVLPVDIEARIYLYPETPISIYNGLSSQLSDAFEAQSGMGWDVTESWLISQLHQPGVQRVELVSPSESVVCLDNQAPLLNAISLTFAGRDR